MNTSFFNTDALQNLLRVTEKLAVQKQAKHDLFLKRKEAKDKVENLRSKINNLKVDVLDAERAYVEINEKYQALDAMILKYTEAQDYEVSFLQKPYPEPEEQGGYDDW